MKDISDYFLSPTKAVSTNTLPSPKKLQKQKEDKKKKPKDAKKLSLSVKKPKQSVSPSNIENDEKSSKHKPNQIKNNRSKLQLKTITLTSSTQSECSNSSSQPISQNDEQTADSTPSKIKVNAFQFLMDSRNNVIGQNTDGKDNKDELSPSSREEKEKIDKRKNFLQEWSEKKGAAKRKREEIEVEKCINKKLEKRAKRLKNMLQGGNGSSQDDYEFCEKKKRRIVRINSGESESGDISEKIDTKINQNPPIIEDINAQDMDFVEITEVVEGMPKKKLKKSKNESKKQKILSLDESSQDSQDLTPKTNKKWSLKIKLNNKVKDNLYEDKKTESKTNVEVSKDSCSVNNKKSYIEIANVTISSGESEDEKPLSDLAKKTTKIAPIFGKSKKVDEKSLEAKRNFLLSGVPDKLKKVVEKQKSIEEIPPKIFPSISHVQQKCDHMFWNLKDVDLNLPLLNLPAIETTNFKCQRLTKKDKISPPINFCKQVEKLQNLKATLDQIKRENPDYPVYKAFRHIYEKSGKPKITEEIENPKKRGRKPKKNIDTKSVECNKLDYKQHKMWSDKYKARCSEEILGNHAGVTKLKKWLETWMNYSEEINLKRRERTGYDSGSDFDTTDCDSRDSVRLPGNTVIVGGPNGSGKTSAIYAIANEFGFNVLEVNASSRRTGKKLQQELQEATQSHQVRKKGLNSIFNLKEPTTTKKTDDNTEHRHKKMCILLIEDVDVIFEQDEGFLSSLSQLIDTSKRPIILTTTDTGPNHIQKLLTQHEYISFAPLSFNTLSVWLQLVCLVEGLFVSQLDLGNLLEYNRGDIRKTLLEVQFWVQSGGQINREEVLPILTTDTSKNWEKTPISDEELNISLHEDCNNETNNFIHTNILGSFEVFKGNNEFHIPLYINLGTLWWNTPNILNLNLPQRRFKNKDKDTETVNNLKKPSLTKVLRYYDSLATIDILHTSLGHCSSMEPVINDWSVEAKDSLELRKRMEDKVLLEVVTEMTHFMVNSCVGDLKVDGGCRVNMALPDSTERRWRAKQHICEDFLKEPISFSSTLERRQTTLDYLPTLRHIARSEKIRSSLNTKRGNRFRHYFKNLNMQFDDNVCKMVSNVLVLDE